MRKFINISDYLTDWQWIRCYDLFLKGEYNSKYTLPYQKFGNDSTKRLNLEMVLALSKTVNLVCTRHIIHM